MEVILQTYYILLPIVATSLIGWVGYLLKGQRSKEQKIEEEQKKIASIRNANSEGIKLVLRYMLNRYHTEYMVQGKMTYDQYKDWLDLFSAYRALGGNSIAMSWNNDIEDLEKCNHLETKSAFESLYIQNIADHKND